MNWRAAAIATGRLVAIFAVVGAFVGTWALVLLYPVLLVGIGVALLIAFIVSMWGLFYEEEKAGPYRTEIPLEVEQRSREILEERHTTGRICGPCDEFHGRPAQPRTTRPYKKTPDEFHRDS